MKVKFRLKRELVRDARAEASRRGTTLEEMVRLFIEHVATTEDPASFIASLNQ